MNHDERSEHDLAHPSADSGIDAATRALVAHDRGDLDQAAEDLVGPPSPDAEPSVVSAPDAGRGWRLAAFVFMAVVSAPFLFLSVVFLFGGSGWSERVFGLVLAVLFLPGLVAIGRWAIRR